MCLYWVPKCLVAYHHGSEQGYPSNYYGSGLYQRSMVLDGSLFKVSWLFLAIIFGLCVVAYFRIIVSEYHSIMGLSKKVCVLNIMDVTFIKISWLLVGCSLRYHDIFGLSPFYYLMKSGTPHFHILVTLSAILLCFWEKVTPPPSTFPDFII